LFQGREHQKPSNMLIHNSLLCVSRRFTGLPQLRDGRAALGS
jgi:hypothetical protein